MAHTDDNQDNTEEAKVLAGQVAIVTGGACNIGRAIAIALAHAGASVVVNARASRSEADETVALIAAAGGTAIACLADVTDRNDVARLVRTTINAFGRIDILINNAVSHGAKAFHELAAEDWRHTLAVTLDGAFNCIQACAPHMIERGGGSIVNIGGSFGHKGSTGRAATAAAKAGLAGLTRALAIEFAGNGINVNDVAPGPVNTLRKVPARIDPKSIPLGRFAEPSEVAAMVRLLCSPEGRYITGQTIHVNGGFVMNN
jgi:3-oxoacyl-[acyl-carrier protein] reductase